MALIDEFVKSVSVVTGGESEARWFADAHPGWEILDLRAYLKKNPNESVAHKVDYKDSHTQAIVIGQSGFPEVMETLLEMCNRGSTKIMIHCTSGWHRASVVGKTLESMGNTIVDPDGNRVFNIQTFCLHSCCNNRMYASTAKNAVDWANAPWELMPAPYKESIVGYTACKQSQASSRNWNYA